MLAVARVAGIMAAKRTGELIPLCHPLPITSVAVDLAPDDTGVTATATVTTTGKTGVEMEAMTAVSVALLTIYDMAKAVDKGMTIGDVRLLEKSGGKSGDWRGLTERIYAPEPDRAVVASEQQVVAQPASAALALEKSTFPRSLGAKRKSERIAAWPRSIAPGIAWRSPNMSNDSAILTGGLRGSSTGVIIRSVILELLVDTSRSRRRVRTCASNNWRLIRPGTLERDRASTPAAAGVLPDQAKPRRVSTGSLVSRPGRSSSTRSRAPRSSSAPLRQRIGTDPNAAVRRARRAILSRQRIDIG